MSLIVFQMPHSPYCIPITQALTALGVAFRTVDITPHTREEVIEASGGKYYQVPMLKDGERIVMESSSESIDIARCIDRKFGKGRLFPKRAEAANLALTRHIENDLEGVGFKLSDPRYLATIKDAAARVLIVRHKERRFGRGCVDMWKREHRALAAQFDALLEEFETTLKHEPFLLGDTPVYADFALFGVIGNVTFSGWNRLSPARKAVAAWRERLNAYRY